MAKAPSREELVTYLAQMYGADIDEAHLVAAAATTLPDTISDSAEMEQFIKATGRLAECVTKIELLRRAEKDAWAKPPLFVDDYFTAIIEKLAVQAKILAARVETYQKKIGALP